MTTLFNDHVSINMPIAQHHFRPSDSEENLPRKQLILERLGESTAAGSLKSANFHSEVKHVSHIRLLGLWVDALEFPLSNPGSETLRVELEFASKNLGSIEGFDFNQNQQVPLKDGLLVPITNLNGWNLFTQKPLMVHRFKNYDGTIKSFKLRFTDAVGRDVSFDNMTLLFEIFTLIEQ